MSEPKMNMNADALYKEQAYTDRRVGTIRTLTPVTANGDIDTARKVIYVGQSQVMTQAGALPLTFEIDADSFADAIEKFSDHAKAEFERTVEEIKEMQRQAASQIVVPGQGGMGGGGIQIP